MRESEIERLIWWMPKIAETARNTWARDFALSILRQSRRPGWRPSPRQAECMSRLVADLFAHVGDDNLVVIEEEGDHAA